MKKIVIILLLFLFFISLNDKSFSDSIPPIHSYKKVTENGKYVFVMVTEFDPLIASSGKQYSLSGLYHNNGSNLPIWTVDWYTPLEGTICVSSGGEYLVRICELTSFPDIEYDIIFYKNGKEMKGYFGSDLVKDPEVLPFTASGRWWMKRTGKEFNDTLNQLTVITQSDEKYVFDIRTGNLIEGKLSVQ